MRIVLTCLSSGLLPLINKKVYYWRGTSLLCSSFWELEAADVIKQLSDKSILNWSLEDLWEEAKFWNFVPENIKGPGTNPAWTLLGTSGSITTSSLILLVSTHRPASGGELTCVSLHIWRCGCFLLLYTGKCKDVCLKLHSVQKLLQQSAR